MLKDEIIRRKEELALLKDKLERSLYKSMDGRLRICIRRGRVQYYHRKDPSDRQGTYISKTKDKALIASLAQKEYERKVLVAANKEIAAIDAFIKLFPVDTAEEVYSSENRYRQDLIKPLWDTDEMYVSRWRNVEYNGKSFPDDFPELITDNGERVRSKSELIIANMLAKEKIPYRYEFPVILKGVGTVYPDFTVLNVRLRKEMYWEHLGMMDDPEYAEKAVRKISAYGANGFFPGDRLILTAETKSTPLNVRLIRDLIACYCLGSLRCL